MLVCAFFAQSCTRDRGCSARPAFPAPSVWEKVETFGQTSGEACRENADAYLLPEFESDVAMRTPNHPRHPEAVVRSTALEGHGHRRAAHPSRLTRRCVHRRAHTSEAVIFLAVRQ